MITRSKRVIFKAKVYTATTELEELTTYEQVIKDRKWKEAMDEEYHALINNNTWELVQEPEHKNIIGCKWTYRLNKNPDGTISKYKARLVANGYSQQYVFDFSNPFSPLVKPTTIRIILTIALHHN